MFFNYKHQKIYYEKIGSGEKTIIILPGWGDVYPTYSSIISHLSSSFTIYYIYYPGFGKSKALSKEFTIYDYSKMILTFIHKNTINNPIILAHSFGGRIASILIGKYHYKCFKLILIDVAGIKHFSLKIFTRKILYKTLKIIRFIIPVCLRDIYLTKLIRFFSSPDYLDLPSSMRKTFQNIVGEDLRKYYSNISCDTLIIWGEKDLDTPLKDAYYIHRRIKNSGLIIYSGCRHYAYLEENFRTILILLSYIKK